MDQAFAEARAAAARGEVPVGAVLVDGATGEVVAAAGNRGRGVTWAASLSLCGRNSALKCLFARQARFTMTQFIKMTSDSILYVISARRPVWRRHPSKSIIWIIDHPSSHRAFAVSTRPGAKALHRFPDRPQACKT